MHNIELLTPIKELHVAVMPIYAAQGLEATGLHPEVVFHLHTELEPVKPVVQVLHSASVFALVFF